MSICIECKEQYLDFTRYHRCEECRANVEEDRNKSISDDGCELLAGQHADVGVEIIEPKGRDYEKFIRRTRCM